MTLENTGETFEVIENFARLLVPEFNDDSLANELSAMEGLPVYGVSYFKQEFFDAMSHELYNLGGKMAGSSFNMIEIGGGDGQFARHFLKFDRRGYSSPILQKNFLSWHLMRFVRFVVMSDIHILQKIN